MNIIVNQKSSQFCDPSLWHERAPPTMSPSPLSASFIGHKCEWTHYVWMSGLSAEEPGSSPPTRRPPLSPIGQPSSTTTSSSSSPVSPRWGGAGSPTERVACAREWTDEICVWIRLAATGKKKQTTTTSEEKRNNTVTQRLQERNSAFWTRLILKSLKGRTLENGKKEKKIITKI